MAEIGLVRFARLAYEVSRHVLPAQRTRFSKRLFTQPQLLAVLSLMRFEDWTFREAEVRLSEHSDLRAALELTAVPDHTTLYRFLLRLEEEDLRRVLAEIVRRVPRRYRRRVRVAVDATGLAQNAISSFVVRRMHHHTDKPMPWRHWLKWINGGRCRPATDSGAMCAPGTVERLRQPARSGSSGTPTDAGRLCAGRRRVRFRA